MKKCLTLLFTLCCFMAMGQTLIKGKVLADGKAIAGAIIKTKNSTTASDANGIFSLKANVGDTIKVSYIGYVTFISTLKLPFDSMLIIDLIASTRQLDEVTINTGYQQLPEERITGSFTVIDQKLINRTVSTNILDRLRDVVPGLSFNEAGNLPGRLNISIRGQSTISANSDPLIILDNFPFDGDINSINPNDVEQITVLKDAAAASIWGARAGNGVIVITTKKGKYNQKDLFSFNSNLTISEKPNLFYKPQIGSSDYIDIQQKLFKEGYYSNDELNDANNISHKSLPDAVEIWIALRDGMINQNTANARLAILRQHDVRSDIQDYLYQQAINQQYSLNFTGGTAVQRYNLGVGYDHNLGTQKGNELSRLTVQGGNSWSLLKDRLQINTGLFYSQTNNQNNAVSFTPRDPYNVLVDGDGNALPLNDYRDGFITASRYKGLLDWTYKPLDEYKNKNNTTKLTDYRLNAGIKYKILPYLNAEVLYQYGRTITDGRNLNGANTYYTRNLINNYTQIDLVGNLIRPIPLGGILDLSDYNNENHSLRSQLNLNKSWGQHELSAIGGYEIKSLNATNRAYRLYGYDNDHATSSLVDYINQYTTYSAPTSKLNIENRDSQTDLTDHYISYYANAAYTYQHKYTISASARLDQSNLFGVETNQKGVPLYSAGGNWVISGEDFYKLKWLPKLNLRATFGYSGNIDKSLSAYTTASYFPASAYVSNGLTQQSYAQIINPPNPSLKWERVKMINLALDYNVLNRINGSFEIYFKKGIDLIGDTPFPPSSGISNFRGNYAGTSGKGFDITLNTDNLTGKFKWQTNFILSYVHEEVSEYKNNNAAISYLTNSGLPMVGKPLYAVYSLPYGGLDKNGDPLGYLNGVLSIDYAKILDTYAPDQLTYHGSLRPTKFGSIRNTFQWRAFSLSTNINFKLGYYFKRNGMVYGSNYGLLIGNGDYAARWQKAGDELITTVPGVPAVANDRRDTFYNQSDILVEKGDHIRLQDIRISYSLNQATFRAMPFRQVEFYAYAGNLWVLYKATKADVDPLYYNGIAPTKNFSIGLKIEL